MKYLLKYAICFILNIENHNCPYLFPFIVQEISIVQSYI